MAYLYIKNGNGINRKEGNKLVCEFGEGYEYLRDPVLKLLGHEKLSDSEIVLSAMRILKSYKKSYGCGNPNKVELLAKNICGLSKGKATQLSVVLKGASGKQIQNILDGKATINTTYLILKGKYQEGKYIPPAKKPKKPRNGAPNLVHGLPKIELTTHISIKNLSGSLNKEEYLKNLKQAEWYSRMYGFVKTYGLDLPLAAVKENEDGFYKVISDADNLQLWAAEELRIKSVRIIIMSFNNEEHLNAYIAIRNYFN